MFHVGRKLAKKTAVVGVGRAGCRAVSVLTKKGLSGATLIAVDTDWTAVRLTDAYSKVELAMRPFMGMVPEAAGDGRMDTLVLS